ncbi:Glu-tRNA(Gln) amidotransferase subunit GatD [Methanococcus voltae]|uniref:Glutamyl-tRNA(Gln) amidotransferase subunit D n=1 Tax=Methanococcus voltae (strain ATCC BAA-1334 / A3) TaxID=456320 RepID=D7DS20_METV3|nr:Glu-tRNA(Gln) amidotransferase subunit GatD [Methanococcus voltae]MCS3901455.1 glutamyl-tRNA(Gln) amidotransferase subunit D [Methanococcus voltae]
MSNCLETLKTDIGDLVEITTKEEKTKSETKTSTTYKGTVMPCLKDDVIMIKMSSGYNAGIKKEKIEEIKILSAGETPKHVKTELNIKKEKKLKNISIISTGGTVASRVDYKTGAVHPAFTADDLIRAVPELLSIANISGKAVMNILSENMLPAYWKEVAEHIENEIKNGADGIVIAHGTDTMHYTASALQFMVKSNVPIILVGAQRSSDRPSSDAALNLIASTKFATEGLSGVYVLMHGENGDEYCYLHKSVKVRKLHSSRRDAFKSVNAQPVAKMNMLSKNKKTNEKDYKIEYIADERELKQNITDNSSNVEINTNLEEKVALLKIYPGINSDILKYYTDNGYKGIILEGTGLGHAPETLFNGIKYAIDNGLLVAMTTQTINGRVNMNVYSNGVELQKMGVISCEDMSAETALVKMMYLLANYNLEEVKELIGKNTVGEITKFSLIDLN